MVFEDDIVRPEATSLMHLPEPILTVFEHFRPEFSRPTWSRVLGLMTGTLLARGRRTVTAALRAIGLSREAGFGRFHDVFSRAGWSPMRLARRLPRALIAAFTPHEGLCFVIDETLERRRGPKITKLSHHRDPIASSKKMNVVASGLRWVVTALVVPVSWSPLPWALPFFSQLAPSEKTDKKRRRRHKTVSHRTRQVVALLRRWLPGVALTLLGDTTYSVIDPGRSCQKRRVRLIAPLWWKACLHQPPPKREPGTLGRPPKVGVALPKLRVMLEDPNTSWTATDIFRPDGTTRRLEWASGTALWNQSGAKPLPIRWVMTRDPSGQFEPRAFFSTEPADEPTWIVSQFARRWTIEVSFAECRAHLGLETQRQWCDASIERQTPCLPGLYWVVTLLAKAVSAGVAVPHQATRWHAKAHATFADCLALVRRHLWSIPDCCEPGSDPGSQQFFGPIWNASETRFATPTERGKSS